MAVYADHLDIPFVEAKTAIGGPAYTRGRPDGPPIWVVVHDMEFPERPDAAEWTAQYFAGQASRQGRSVSSHYVADATSVLQCVRLADVAWTVGNRPGNYRGINWELAGYASQTREQWLDEFGRAMLARAAVIMRRDMAEYHIPARVLTDAEVKAFTAGVTSHWQLGRVFGGSDHTDPGRGFPWDHLIDLLTGDDDMTPQEFKDMRLKVPGFELNGIRMEDLLGRVLNRLPTNLVTTLDALLARGADPTDPGVDEGAAAALAEIKALIVAVPTEVAAELGRALTD